MNRTLKSLRKRVEAQEKKHNWKYNNPYLGMSFEELLDMHCDAEVNPPTCPSKFTWALMEAYIKYNEGEEK